MNTIVGVAVPLFLALIVLEWRVGRVRFPDLYERRDTFASLALGLGSALFGLGARLLYWPAFEALYAVRVLDLGRGLLAWVLLFFAEDFCYYVAHRSQHSVRALWAAHENHHSSEHFNFAVALRQSWTQPLLVYGFWAPLPLLGFAPDMVLTMQSISLVYQFFIHTALVGRLGILEWVLNTPSHHRVHHASNPVYLDRNHGGVLIIWDRMFGTFARERQEWPPQYGLTHPVSTHNPVRLAFHEFARMFRDVWRAPTLGQKLRYVLGRPGYSHDGSSRTADELRLDGTGSR